MFSLLHELCALIFIIIAIVTQIIVLRVDKYTTAPAPSSATNHPFLRNPEYPNPKKI